MRIERILTLLLLGGAAALAQTSTGAAKQVPPAGGPAKPFNLPPIHRFTLPNGMRATLVEYGDIPKATVRVVLRTGKIDEAESQTDLSVLTAQLMKEGTKTRSGEQIAAQAASMGGVVSADPEADETSFDLDVLGEFAPKAVQLLADVVENPAFPEKDFDRLRNDQERSIAIEKSQPSGQAFERWYKLLYANHPYGRVFPSDAVLNADGVNDATKFYNDNYGALRAAVYVVGKFDEAAVRREINAAFASWRKGVEATNKPPKPIDKPVFGFVDRPGAAQSTIRIGLPTIDPSQQDYVPLTVMNALLGGSFGSRITANIREQKGYTYSPSSTVSVRFRDGYWAETADVTTAVTGPAIKEIRNEITRLQNEPPSEEELQGIKNYLSGLFVIRNSSRGGLLNQLQFVDLHGLGERYMADYVPRVSKVTTAEVQSLAKKYLALDKIRLVVVGDPEKVKPQIQEFATPSS